MFPNNYCNILSFSFLLCLSADIFPLLGLNWYMCLYTYVCVCAHQFSSLQFSCSVMSDSLWPHGDCSTPGLPVHHQLPEFTQTHVHRVGDAIQPSVWSQSHLDDHKAIWMISHEDQGIWSHHFMADRWGNSGNSDRLYFGRLQNHCRWWLQPY